MIEEIKKGRLEFEKNNVEQAIKHFDNVCEQSKWYSLARILKANCLMEMKDYENALVIFNDMISKSPYDELLWIEKTFCHIGLKDHDGAIKALGEVDRVVGRQDKSLMVRVAKLYDLVGDYENALRYCDYALDMDSKFKEALYVKASILIQLGDNSEVNEISDRLVEVSDGKLIGLMPVFLMKLFSGNYRGCLDLVNNCDKGDLDDEHVEMLKAAIFTQISEELSVQLLMLNSKDIGIDDALDAMLDFVETGKDSGSIGGVQYFII